VRCPRDRRQVLCHATPLALRLLAPLDATVAQAGQHAVAALDPAGTAELVRLLDAVRASAASPIAPDGQRRSRKPVKRNKKENLA